MIDHGAISCAPARTSATPKPLFCELEGLRGLCAVMVFLCHWSETLAQASRASSLHWLDALPAPYGFASVMVFFILSGFVIGNSTPVAANRRNLLAYIEKRFLRLYPIYLIALLASFSVAGFGIFSKFFVLHMVFLQDAVIDPIISNGPLWSLNYEILYYLTFAVLWFFPRAFYVVLILIPLALILDIMRSGYIFDLISLFGFWIFGLMLKRHSSLLSHVVEDVRSKRFWPALFLLGANMSTNVWVALFKQVGFHTTLPVPLYLNCVLIADIFLSVIGKRVCRTVALPFYTLSAAGTVLGLAYAFSAHKFAIMPSYDIAMIYFALALAAWFARFPSPNSAQWTCFTWLGGISYALYVIHSPVLYAADRFFPKNIAAMLLAAPVSFGAAFFLERVLQPAIKRFFYRFVRPRYEEA